jgi:hypothetical protein
MRQAIGIIMGIIIGMGAIMPGIAPMCGRLPPIIICGIIAPIMCGIIPLIIICGIIPFGIGIALVM